MIQQVHTEKVKLDWKLMNAISELDRFDATWSSLEKTEGKNLKELKSIATVRSVGASTRIEGSVLSDQEISVILNDIKIYKFEDRDSQEVLGYFNVMDLISEAFNDIQITESEIKNLHNLLLQPCDKDNWHKGNYKQHSNAVEAVSASGERQIIFKTSAPGFATEQLMQDLAAWYKADLETHPIIKCATFCYDFVSIHPFQDGNGRMSRLLAMLLLLKNGYKWIQYVSFEHEIENRKNEYYRTLRNCQANRPNEDITDWIYFFLTCLKNIQGQLLSKLSVQGSLGNLSPKEKNVYLFIQNNIGCKTNEIASKLAISNSTVKNILSLLLSQSLIIKYGNGAGTNYGVV